MMKDSIIVSIFLLTFFPAMLDAIAKLAGPTTSVSSESSFGRAFDTKKERTRPSGQIIEARFN